VSAVARIGADGDAIRRLLVGDWSGPPGYEAEGRRPSAVDASVDEQSPRQQPTLRSVPLVASGESGGFVAAAVMVEPSGALPEYWRATRDNLEASGSTASCSTALCAGIPLFAAQIL